MPTPQRMGLSRQYSKEKLLEASADVISGTLLSKQASVKYAIPQRTIQKYVAILRLGQSAPERQRPGPKPVMPAALEKDLVDWIAGMQSCGHPVQRQTITLRAARICRAFDQTMTLSSGWYQRFLARHPILAKRTAQVISRSRNEVCERTVEILYDSLATVVNEHKLDSTRIFNMDETAFNSRKKSKVVVALRGSKNVWAKDINTNFHMSIAACGNAAGLVIPPLFIMPGDTVKRSLSSCEVVLGSRITTSNKGWMTEYLFLQWLDFFNESVPASIQRPVLLVFDGLASHYGYDILEKCEKLQIVLLCLPANATHLFHPLDVCVFGPYKHAIRDAIASHMPAAVTIASQAWSQHVSSANMIAGFVESGLWPVSLDQMLARLSLFKEGGLKKGYTVAGWLKFRKGVQDGELTLPPRTSELDSSKTVTVAGRLLTVKLLRDIDASKEAKAAATAAKKALKAASKSRKGKGKAKLVARIVQEITV
ncbi:hypothetical protein DYB25_003636 [Aphanomyces astaci]|uniref:HTH CENPB-type domain-containing protein n=1 Tax=Aphanomyces astaci TaxID=112090 RepID=A0A397BD37_APHAT|nr:hypothetical protein DYB36_004398 [Aphanomyces astaci]RHY15717.1 hypothetical protein DYB25_003636 [Aphanomyces astaci]RHZ13439.1 hypothetical protein DYB26_009213 [Aphanomyces astaci]